MTNETLNNEIEVIETKEEVEMKTGVLSKVINVVKNNKGKVIAGAALVGLGVIALLRKGNDSESEDIMFYDCDEDVSVLEESE